MTKGPIPLKMKAKRQHKDATKTSITQRLRTDLALSFGETTAIQLVWFNWYNTYNKKHDKFKIHM